MRCIFPCYWMAPSLTSPQGNQHGLRSNQTMTVLHVHMTSDKVWEPHEYTVHNDEEALRASLDYMPRERGRVIQSVHTINSCRSSAAIDIDSLAESMEQTQVRCPLMPLDPNTIRLQPRPLRRGKALLELKN